MDENKTVDGTQVAVPEVATDTTTRSEIDYPALVAEKDAEIAKVREEKENYRKGMLIAKGKLTDDTEGESETDEERMRRIVQEELLNTKEARLLEERKSAEQAVMKENAELRLALKNQNTSTSGGSSTARADENKVVATSADKFFSEAQLAELKKKGLDPEKVMANMKKSISAVPTP